jgi:hypothetical protein
LKFVEELGAVQEAARGLINDGVRLGFAKKRLDFAALAFFPRSGLNSPRSSNSRRFTEKLWEVSSKINFMREKLHPLSGPTMTAARATSRASRSRRYGFGQFPGVGAVGFGGRQFVSETVFQPAETVGKVVFKKPFERRGIVPEPLKTLGEHVRREDLGPFGDHFSGAEVGEHRMVGDGGDQLVLDFRPAKSGQPVTGKPKHRGLAQGFPQMVVGTTDGEPWGFLPAFGPSTLSRRVGNKNRIYFSCSGFGTGLGAGGSGKSRPWE